MLLSITTTHTPATDLGFLLHKHPDEIHKFELPFGGAYVFYPEASAARCTATLLLDIDPVSLKRKDQGNRAHFELEEYVNDRPYVASSFLSVAMTKTYGTALSGRSKERQELADTAIPLQAEIHSLPCYGGEELLKKLFEPLGYTVSCESIALDPRFPEWGDSPYMNARLEAHLKLQDLLTHLYVLIPVLDNDKHYWVGDDEVEKLLRRGQGWLSQHPQRDLITRRYLRNKRHLMKLAMNQLIEEEAEDPDELAQAHCGEEEAVERPISLNERRLQLVHEVLKKLNCRRVIDLGCGGGNLLRKLFEDREFEQIVGMDVSHRALEYAGDKLRIDGLPDRQKQRIALIQGSLTYTDKRLAGFDAATCVEVIEHLDAARLNAFQNVLFKCCRPSYVIVTTPNSEYNVRFESLPAGQFRHKDHRFEWTRAEFSQWAQLMCQRYQYSVELLPVGDLDPEVGSPTQMAVFSRAN